VALLYPHHRPGAAAKLHTPAEGVWTLQTAWHIVGDGGATGQLGGALTLIGSSPALQK
jgi:hypothetical protein